MFRDLWKQGAASSLQDILNTVENGGEPAVFSSLAYVGDLEALTEEVRRREMRIAAFPKGGVTVLPKVAMSRDELFEVCLSYHHAPTPVARAAIRQSLYLRDYPSFVRHDATCQPFYHPADSIMKIVELCARVAAATPEELTVMIDRTPYLHLSLVRSICDELRQIGSDPDIFAENSPSGQQQPPENMVAFREMVNEELSSHANLPVVNVTKEDDAPGIAPDQLFNEDALEPDTGGLDGQRADLTGTEEVDHVIGATAEYLSEADYTLVTQSTIFYDGEGDGRRLAAVYVTGGLDPGKCKEAARALEAAATHQNMRARTNGGVAPDTGIVGYYDYLNHPSTHKCRETSFMRDNFAGVMHGAGPLLRQLDRLYRDCAPMHHNLQRIAIPTQYQLFGTVFSTVTVNKNFRTAVHTDSGDFRGGLGAVCVVDGQFEGCHLAIKKLRKSFQLKVGDVLFFDTTLEHGNTEVLNASAGWKRISLVCYLRNGLMSAVCELERRKHLNRLIVASLQTTLERNAVVNINSVDNSLPPLFVPARLASKLAAAQLSALTFVSERTQKNTGCVLAMTMGLGKTLVALVLCYSFLHQFPDRDILVVVPKPIIQHWVAESEKWLEYGLHFNRLVAADGTNGRRFEEGLLEYEKQITGHRSMRQGHLFLVNPEYYSIFSSRFKMFDPVLIIVDEGHMVASRGSKLTASLSRLRCPLRVVLSGTPLQNSADELYRLVGWVNSGVRAVVPPRLFNELAGDINRYVKGDDSAFPDAMVAQRYILDWMKGFVFREVEIDLPPLHDYLLICGSSATQRRIEANIGLPRSSDGGYTIASAADCRIYHLSTHPLCYWAYVSGTYRSLVKSARREERSGAPSQRVQLSEEDLRCVELYYSYVQTGQLGEYLALSGKLAALAEIVYHVKRRDEKMVIFSQFTGPQDLIHRTLTAMKVSCFTVRGRDGQDRRREAMMRFCQDSRVTAIILSTKIAAFGLDFTAANHVVLFDSWWNPQVDSQAVARAYRRNQTKPVTVYRLASDAEDRSVLTVQTRKMALFNCIMNERTSRSALPGEVQDCAGAEEDDDRRALWASLKNTELEGGAAVLQKIFHYKDNVKERPIAASRIIANLPQESTTQ